MAAGKGVDADIGKLGIGKMLLRRQAPEPGGEVLGFEVLGFYYQEFESWTCNSIPEEYSASHQIEFSKCGLVKSLDQARLAALYANNDGKSMWHGSWLPWMTLQYPIFVETA